jgi:hypothetical protein
MVVGGNSMKCISYRALEIQIKDTQEAIKGKDIFYKCKACNSIIASLPKDNANCSCGNIGIDKDLHRLFVRDYSNFLILVQDAGGNEAADGHSNLKSFFTGTGFLVIGLLVIGAIILLGGSALADRVYRSDIPDGTLAMIMIVAFPWFMASCVFAVLRREIPGLGLPSIKGKWAVVQGLIGLAVLICAEVYAIYLFVRSSYPA